MTISSTCDVQKSDNLQRAVYHLTEACYCHTLATFCMCQTSLVRCRGSAKHPAAKQS